MGDCRYRKHQACEVGELLRWGGHRAPSLRSLRHQKVFPTASREEITLQGQIGVDRA